MRNTDGWERHVCTLDCDVEGVDLVYFPPEGTRVVVLEAVTTRTPGDDEMTDVEVAAGTTGVVTSYVEEWHDVDVLLDTGVSVWIDPDNLDTAKEKA